jgi:hypothetical protein
MVLNVFSQCLILVNRHSLLYIHRIVVGLTAACPIQSVPITTKVVSSNPAQTRFTRLNIIVCDKVCQWLAAGQWFSLGTPVSSTNKTDRHDITEILLKVSLNTINSTNHRLNIGINGLCKMSYICHIKVEISICW